VNVNDRECIANVLSVEWTPSRPKRSASMLLETMIVLAKGCFDSQCDVCARPCSGHASSALRMVAR
jgi:hypothetical protein